MSGFGHVPDHCPRPASAVPVSNLKGTTEHDSRARAPGARLSQARFRCHNGNLACRCGRADAADRAEVAGYGGQVIAGTVTAVTRLPGTRFAVTLADQTRWQARRVLVATGLVDDIPDIPGLRERWGRDVVHCPFCFGWELRDAPLGVLGTGPQAAAQALMWRQWSVDVAPAAEQVTHGLLRESG
jgi:hypothetical protein